MNCIGKNGREETRIQDTGGKKLLGRPTRKRKDNLAMDLKETGCEVLDRTRLAQEGDKWRSSHTRFPKWSISKLLPHQNVICTGTLQQQT